MTVCRVCGKPLSNPKSVAAGIGPVCAARIAAHVALHGNGFSDAHLNVPLSDGIIIRRRDGEVETNVPHLVIYHSYDGFNFGYAGSGPADLALNIVEAIVRQLGVDTDTVNCFEGTSCTIEAWQLHQDFKRQFLVTVPEDGGVIQYDVAVDWVRNRLNDR